MGIHADAGGEDTGIGDEQIVGAVHPEVRPDHPGVLNHGRSPLDTTHDFASSISSALDLGFRSRF